MTQGSTPGISAFPSKHAILGGLRTRIVATVSLLAGGLAFAVLFLAFVATKLPWYQNLGVLLADLIVVPAIVIVMWISWGIGIGRRFHEGW